MRLLKAETIVNESKGNKNGSQLILSASCKIASAYDKKRSDRFMETLIPIYAELKRPMPARIISIYKEIEQFNEIAQVFILNTAKVKTILSLNKDTQLSL